MDAGEYRLLDVFLCNLAAKSASDGAQSDVTIAISRD
jgi:hypothetical protein